MRTVNVVKNCTKFLCHKCYGLVQTRLPGSHANLIKSMRQCRHGAFRMTKSMCKGCIGVDIISKTLDLKNLNIELDNFNSGVDLSRHEKYGYIEVKTSSFKNGAWQFDIKERQLIAKKFDTVFLLCMDKNWKDFEMIYAIRFKIDKNPFNCIYHKIDSTLSYIKIKK